MTEGSRPLTFAERLQAQRDKDFEALRAYRLQTEAAMKEELRELSETSTRLFEAELKRAEAATLASLRTLAQRVTRWTLVALGASLAIWLVAWQITRSVHRQASTALQGVIEERVETLLEASADRGLGSAAED